MRRFFLFSIHSKAIRFLTILSIIWERIVFLFISSMFLFSFPIYCQNLSSVPMYTFMENPAIIFATFYSITSNKYIDFDSILQWH